MSFLNTIHKSDFSKTLNDLQQQNEEIETIINESQRTIHQIFTEQQKDVAEVAKGYQHRANQENAALNQMLINQDETLKIQENEFNRKKLEDLKKGQMMQEKFNECLQEQQSQHQEKIRQFKQTNEQKAAERQKELANQRLQLKLSSDFEDHPSCPSLKPSNSSSSQKATSRATHGATKGTTNSATTHQNK